MIEGIDRVDLLAMVEADGVALRKCAGDEYAGPCPLCGGDDRLHVLETTKAGKPGWFCRKCASTPKPDRPGDAMDYVRIVRGLVGAEAFALLRRYGLPGDGPTARVSAPVTRPAVVKSDAGIILPADGRLPDPPSEEWRGEVDVLMWSDRGTYSALRADGADAIAARAYLADVRRLSWATVNKFALGYLAVSVTTGPMRWPAATRGAIVVPWWFDGGYWRVQYRAVGDVPKDQRFRQKAGHGEGARPPFNGDAITDSTRAVVVVEGEFDAMLGDQHAPDGVAVVTWGSASNGPNAWAAAMLEGRRVLLAFDGDESGDAAASAWARLGVRVALPAGKDLTEFAQAGGDVGAWLREVTR